MKFSISFLLGVSLLAVRVQADCEYNGQWYSSKPNTPVVGSSLTCFCSGTRWIKCKKNEPPLRDDGHDSHYAGRGPHYTTAVDHRGYFNPYDFVFNLGASMPTSNGLGGEIRPVGVAELPALSKNGVAMSLFILEPCGINLPHVHPRATEILYVIEAEKLIAGFAEENGGGRTVLNELYSGFMTFFPQGLIHYQQNVSCKPAKYISALNSEDPGVVTISSRLFELPDEALQATFALDRSRIRGIRDAIPAGPAKGVYECLERCRGVHSW